MNNFIKTGVIGNPISHSKSPLIHNYWINKYDFKGEYKAIDIHPDNLRSGVQELINIGYTGFNVTIPHKITIMDLCHEVDNLALKIGAVNTITIKNGKLHGSNTDAYGFIQNIKTNAPDFDFTKGKTIILGAGGATNAVLYALLQENIPEIIITNRTREKAEILAQGEVKVINWEDRNNALKDANLIINATSLGMTGKPELEIDLSNIHPNTLINDIVYAPLYTNLLKQAKAQDLQVVTGIGMLLHQAKPAFEKWYGISPHITKELENMVLS